MINTLSSSASLTLARPDAQAFASRLFTTLDTQNKGYLEVSDLQSALKTASDSATNSDSSDQGVSQLFSALDGDNDGKLSESELSTGLRKLAEQLGEQWQNGRLDQARSLGPGGPRGGEAGPPPPPPDDEGFSKDALQAQLDELTQQSSSTSGSQASQRNSDLTKLVANFDSADTNQDGKLTGDEAISYLKTQDRSTTDATTRSNGMTGHHHHRPQEDGDQGDALVQRLAQLLQAYQSASGTRASTDASTSDSAVNSISAQA